MVKCRVLVVFSLAILGSVFLASQAVADPATELAEAQQRESSAAAAAAAAAEEAKKEAEAAYEPVADRAEAADEEVSAAEERLESVKADLVAERRGAAGEIEAAEAAYEDEKSSHDTTTAVGIAIAIAALVAAMIAFGFSRFRRWPLSKPLTQVLGAGLAVVFIGGLLLAFVPGSPQRPAFSDETEELARAAAGDPADPPSPELVEAEGALPPLKEAAAPLDAAAERAKKRYDSSAAKNREAQSVLASAEKAVESAEREVEKVEAAAHEEEEFKEQATTIDYDQLLKNPEAYRGEKVVYTGQILQIQEEAGIGIMLLSVTDEGYGFWTDNIWVDFFEPVGAAEEDVITVYGKLTGSEEYETQIGGSTYVPRMNAKYVEE